VREAQWKYTELPVTPGHANTTFERELYELSNVASDPGNAARIAQMAARLRQLRPNWPIDSDPNGPDPAENDERAAAGRRARCVTSRRRSADTGSDTAPGQRSDADAVIRHHGENARPNPRGSWLMTGFPTSTSAWTAMRSRQSIERSG
jgi:hypothetical protein